MTSYVILAIKVPVDIDQALDVAGAFADTLRQEPGVEDVTVLNTIAAPE